MNQSLQDALARYARECHEEELALLRELGRIPAPSHHEERRAAFVASWLSDRGAANVHIDDANNVICLLGNPDAPNIHVFSAHTDVVFDDQDELPLTEDDERMYAPGIGDDTANLVGLMMATNYLLAQGVPFPDDTALLVVANSCEEGLGNLKGTRAVFDAFGDRIKEFVSFDLYLPGIVSTAVGSHRFRISVKTTGGHAYHDFGKPNAIAELAALICELYAVVPPDDTVTFNVGRIEGGTTINSIASEASVLYEYRSTSQDALAAMRETLEGIVAAQRREDVEVELEPLGIRPGNGPVDPEALAALTNRNSDVIRSVTGMEPVLVAASTDANIPLSLGIAANTLGAVHGALAHTREEWILKESLVGGLVIILGCMLSSLSS